MSAGIGIFLLVAGAILKFAVEAEVSGFNLQDAGLIMMIAGAGVLLISLIMMMKSRRRVATTRTIADGPNGPVETAQTTDSKIS